jgi:hypothetical protein
MARPIESLPTLKGQDAIDFLREKERIEKLDPRSKEAKARNAFLDRCVDIYNKTRPVNL